MKSKKKKVSPPAKPVRIIDKASVIVDVEREAEYGNPVVNAVAEAAIAATMGVMLSPSDVVRVMIAKKIRRTENSGKEDTRVDIIGYTEILDRTIKAERSGETQSIAKALFAHLL